MSPLPPSWRQFSNPAMQGSLGSIIWTICYLSVLVRPFCIRDSPVCDYLPFPEKPEAGRSADGHFEQLPKVTMQLPIFNEVYVVERLLNQSARSIIRGNCCRSRFWTIPPTTRAN